MSYSPTYRDEYAISKHFIRVLEERLAGRDATRRTNTHPLDWCHLGILGPAKLTHTPIQIEAAQIDAELAPEETAVSSVATVPKRTAAPAPVSTSPGKTSEPEDPDAEPKVAAEKGEDREGTRRPPSALGFEVLLQPDEQGFVEIEIGASFCIFTKHLPSYAEQTAVLEGASEGAPLAEVVHRWPLDVQGMRFRFSTTKRQSLRDDGRIQARVNEALNAAFSRDDAEREWPGNRPKVDGAAALKDERSFAAVLRNLVGGLSVERWDMRLCVEVRVTPRPDGTAHVGCYIRNDTPEAGPEIRGRGLKNAFKIVGDAALHAHVLHGKLRPVEILPVAQDYQYDRRVWSVGHNTSAKVELEAKRIETAALAQFEQIRVMTRDDIPAIFEDLALDPFPTLASIHTEMLKYGLDWQRRVIDRNVLSLDAAALAQCGKDYAGFHDEIRRFAAGIAALKADSRLLLAFKAANRIFGRLARGYTSWRLFQLVFIVTQLPSLLVREGITSGEYPPGERLDWGDSLDWGDVLWFRTGGGKTEAYLGLACCAMLFDRLRGKNFGLTAWLRFPLRMLSIQQLQRAMRVVWETEKERRVVLGPKADTSDPIRLGYFVGSTTTPNSVSEEFLRKYDTPESLERLRVVPDCPECGGQGTVKVTTDLKALRFRHICLKCSAELPLDISDDEVFRYLPSLVVGTIDKMASVGQQPKYGMLWGGAKWRCPIHGYAFGQYCSAYGCKIDRKSRTPVRPYDPAPAFHIQDELHLLQEELGAFAGHYETLIRYCEECLSGKPSKIVAATATIEGFEHQMQHLYGVKGVRRFPGRGYDKAESFYARPDLDAALQPRTGRFFVAFKSASLTPADASAYCTEIIQTEIGNLIRNPHLVLALVEDANTTEDVSALLRYYTTTLNYVGSLQRGARVNQALQDVATMIRQPGMRDMNVEYHSSRSTSAEVAHLVHRVESPPTWDDASFLDALVATNMISHGVDLERVNLMTMDGVPEETAEYIQASSRSGRRHIGLVVVVLAGFSVRATSIYHRFIEFHRHLDRMVSPVPVNRFAKYAAQRTLPGVALGLVYGKHAASSGKSGLNKRNEVATLFGSLGPSLLEEVKDAFCVGHGSYDIRLEQGLTETLREALDTVTLSIRNSHESNVKDAIRPAPMRSLRDVEAGVSFWPDASSQLLLFVQKTKE